MDIRFDNFNLGGIADSKYQGVQNSLASMVGFDVHSEPGILKVNQRLVNEAGTEAFVKVIVPCSDGNSYLFCDNGRVYKRNSAGTYTTLASVSGGAILGAAEFEGYIYYATSANLGRWQIGTDWSTRSDTWAAFANGDASYHPMHAQNLVLYIGDKNYVAQVENNVFTPNALDLEKQYRIASLGEMGSDLLIGTYVSDNVTRTRIFRWNTWSVSYSSSDQIPEMGVNSFLNVDNYVLVQAGNKGNLYVYNGESLERFKRIPGDWSGSNGCIVHPDASDNFLGLPLFGLSKHSGSPTCPLGVYSFGSYAKNYPDILNLEYVVTSGSLANLEIGSVKVVWNDVLVSWKVGTSYGVDKIDWTTKYSGAYFETRLIQIERDKLKSATAVVPFRTMPEGCGIQIWTSSNYGAYVQQAVTVDTAKRVVFTKDRLPDASVLQIKAVVQTSGNNAPEIEALIYRING